MIEVFLIAAFLYGGVQTLKRTDPGGSYSAGSAAVRGGARTAGRSARETWDARRPNRHAQRADRRQRWQRSGLPGWLLVLLERAVIGTGRLVWDGGAATVVAVRDGGRAARDEWRTTWADHHPAPAPAGPAGGPDQPADQPADQPTAARLPVREPEPGPAWWEPVPEPVLVGAGAPAADDGTAPAPAPAPVPAPRVDPPTCSQCGQAATWGIRRGDAVICQDCAIRNAAEDAAHEPPSPTAATAPADVDTAPAPTPPGPPPDSAPDTDGAPAPEASTTPNPFTHGGPPGMTTATSTQGHTGVSGDADNLANVMAWCDAARAEIEGGTTGALVKQATHLYEGFNGAIAGIGGQVGERATAVQSAGGQIAQALSAFLELVDALKQAANAARGD